MGKYDAWRGFFETLAGDRRTVPLSDLEALVDGQLPPSARKYEAWWSGDRYYAVWREYGWRASPELRDERVTFSRQGQARPKVERQGEVAVSTTSRQTVVDGPRLVLVGCVKTKVPYAAPAKDLYDSPLWWRRRRYAESTGMPWAILSAEHGMVEPGAVLEPYDRYLGNESVAYRRRWSKTTANQVLGKLKSLHLQAVEVHASSAYLNNGLRQILEDAGIEVFWPVEGLSFGKQLGWYQ